MTTIPGSNLLNTALTVIGKQTFFYYKFLTRSTNPDGQDVPIYDAPLRKQASIQPVPRELYAEQGLDLQRHYQTVYAPLNVLDIARDSSGDLVMYKGRMYQVLSGTKWFQQDGWGGFLIVQIPDQPLIEGVTPPVPNNYTTGESLEFVAEFSLPVAVTGVPALDIAIGGVARQASYVSGTQVMQFSYTIQSGDSGTVTFPLAGQASTPAIDLSNATIIGSNENGVGANVNFIAPNLAGVTANA